METAKLVSIFLLSNALFALHAGIVEVHQGTIMSFVDAIVKTTQNALLARISNPARFSFALGGKEY